MTDKELVIQQHKAVAHDQWLSEQVNAAYSKIESGQSEFISHKKASLDMEARKANIRNKASQ